MRKTFGMNQHQKAAHRIGEQRVGREDIAELLVLSHSDAPEDRLLAAQYLCPCHVRHRIEAVWRALYRMLEDPDVRVRRASWHTLEDGGHPDDPALDAIIERTLRNETDARVLGFVRHVAQPRQEKERVALKLTGQREVRQRGKCDFCGENNVLVRRDLETMIPTGGMSRAALMCDECAKERGDSGQ